MSPVESAFLAAGAVAAFEVVLGAAILGWRTMRQRSVGRSKPLVRRLRRAAAPLSGAAGVEETSGEESIFRADASRSRFAWLWALVESGYPLVDARRALPLSVVTGAAGAGGCWLSMWFLRVPSGWWTLPAVALVGAGVVWYTLRWQQTSQEAEFVRHFPEIVDQIVRLGNAGMPSLEALSVVTEDAPPPVEPVLRSVRDGLIAGLDADVALRMASDRVRMAEFTMFAAVIRMQRRSGGGVSSAFANLSTTLRERRKTSLKARASTAQTRLTLLVLALMPVAVLLGQKFLSPESVDVLFSTEQGTTLLQVGVALIVGGLLVARGIAARAAR